MKTVNEIRLELSETSQEGLSEFLEIYADDPRDGVRKLLSAAKRKYEAYEKELIRTREMWHYEKLYPELSFIGGIDEVGRGPLAGPVVTACVILPKDCGLLYINDSKQVPEKKREELYDQIMEQAVSVGIGMEEPEVIDRINILEATYSAMRKAIEAGPVKPEHLLVDAVKIPGITIPQRGIIKGDAKSISIAAASIVAKVTRDRMMVEYDRIYPGYGFASNKGYGSADHIRALKELGPTPIHRRTFIGHFV